MNPILQIKMPFQHEPNPNRPGPRNFRANHKTTSNKIDTLIKQLNKVKTFFLSENRFVKNILVDVYYDDIIAKSSRIKELLKDKNECNDSIVGARFYVNDSGKENHVITHYVSRDAIEEAITKLEEAKNFIDNCLDGEANLDNFRSDIIVDYSKSKLPKTRLRDLIIDCSVINQIDVPNGFETLEEDYSIVTFYQTELSLSDLFYELNITTYYRVAGKNTISASKETVKELMAKVPYLISMVASDLSKITSGEVLEKKERFSLPIPKPGNEPTIGVIDTLFDKTVYFSEWVDYRETLTDTERLSVKKDHFEHGTAISSLIVDGPALNPWLDDGCGRFKVRHFGVCPGRIVPTLLIEKIKKIINDNPDIHVWNLSLGTDEQVSKNFISFDGAALDEIQKEKNVIFIVSGTNDERKEKKGILRVGSPADSLNSIVVNSVKRNGSPVSYARNGKILSFFNKPDVSYYGGDFDERINVVTNKGSDRLFGTSLAAPWISRKVCYLIDILGFPKEVAKAIIVDSAAGWEYKQQNYKNQNIIGYGIVPIKINTIVGSDNSEIKFTIYGTANSYKTSNYAIPVPKDVDKSFYIARATLCYFPDCNRLQGVDYTQRELSLSFGIMNGRIVDINYNTQEQDGSHNDERKSRQEFRKWENTKFVSSLLRTKNIRPHQLYGEGFWGVSLASKERATIAKMDDLNFGVVITLKNVKGLNRINEFKHLCLLRGYIVNDVDIENKIDIYNSAQEDVVFE